MIISYLREKKHHDNRKKNSYGWSYWELTYKVDFTKRRGKKKTKWDGVRIVKYKAYIQTESDNRWDDYPSKLMLTIYKTITHEPVEDTQEMIERKIADLKYFKV